MSMTTPLEFRPGKFWPGPVLPVGLAEVQRGDLVGLLARLEFQLRILFYRCLCHFRVSPRFRFALVGDAYTKCTRSANLAVNLPLRKSNKPKALRGKAVLVPGQALNEKC